VGARRHLGALRAAGWWKRASDIPERDELLPCVGIAGRQHHRLLECGDRRVGPAEPLPRQAEAVPRVRVRRVDAQRSGKAALGVLRPVVAQGHEAEADLDLGQAGAERVGDGERVVAS
jgi:hypothetical protein